MSAARVLTVVSDLGIGGTQRAAENLALAYDRLGYESGVLAFVAGGPRSRPLAEAGIEVLTPEGGSDPVAGAAAAWRPDLVHVHRAGFEDAASGSVLERLRRAPVEAVVETSVFGRPDYSRAGDLIDLHTHISLWSAWRWTRQARWRGRRSPACVLHYVCDTEAFAGRDVDGREVRGAVGVPAGAFLVGRVGQPSEAKWSRHTVDAFARLAGGSDDAWLLLVGPPPSVRAQVAALPDAARARVRVLDPTGDEARLRAVYATLDVFLHSSSIGESFGMVLAESLCATVPVVTLSTPGRDNGQCEVVGDGVGGFVCASTSEMVEALVRLRSDGELRRSLGKQGRDRIERFFGLDVVEARLGIIAHAVLTTERGQLAGRLHDLLGTQLEEDLTAHLGAPGEDPTERLLRSALAGRGPSARVAAAAMNHPARLLRRHPVSLATGALRR